jgi:hypothetical protein
MTDLKGARAMWLKAVLLLLIGIAAAALVVAELPSIKTVLLLAISIWGFCRAYYFAFYVIQHYIDPDFRFSGLGSFVRYLFRRRKPGVAGKIVSDDQRPRWAAMIRKPKKITAKTISPATRASLRATFAIFQISRNVIAKTPNASAAVRTIAGLTLEIMAGQAAAVAVLR